MIIPNDGPSTRKEWILSIVGAIVCVVLCFLYYILLLPYSLELVNFLREPWFTVVEYLLTTLPVLVFFLLIGTFYFWTK
jgi:hypothetical protein